MLFPLVFFLLLPSLFPLLFLLLLPAITHSFALRTAVAAQLTTTIPAPPLSPVRSLSLPGPPRCVSPPFRLES